MRIYTPDSRAMPGRRLTKEKSGTSQEYCRSLLVITGRILAIVGLFYVYCRSLSGTSLQNQSPSVFTVQSE